MKELKPFIKIKSIEDKGYRDVTIEMEATNISPQNFYKTKGKQYKNIETAIKNLFLHLDQTTYRLVPFSRVGENNPPQPTKKGAFFLSICDSKKMSACNRLVLQKKYLCVLKILINRFNIYWMLHKQKTP